MHFFCKCLKISMGNFDDFWAFSAISRRIGLKWGFEKLCCITHVHNNKERACVRVKNYRAGVKGGMFLRR